MPGRGAEVHQGSVHFLGILRSRANQYIEVLGGSWVTVERDGVAPDNDELRRVIRERQRHVAKIVGQLDHCTFPRMNR